MILRKPFAILIKYFKLIHAILTVLSFYLLYRTSLLMNFFSEYMQTHNSVIGKDLTGELFSPLMYVSLFVIVVGTIIILGLMLFKKKKVKLYIYNIIAYIAVTIVFVIANSILSTLEIELVDIRTLKMIQDLLTTIFAIQILSFFFVGFRATGFDVKKFDFKKDLQELEIEDVDNEEFEVNVDLDSDETKRKINRAIRHAKYVYKENKVAIIGILIVAAGIISYTIYMNVGVYNKFYNKGEAFTTNFFTMQLDEAYYTNQDYKENKILDDEETLLAININLKNTTMTERAFETARLILQIDEHSFSHQSSYGEKIFDLGTPYTKQNVPNEFEKYMFIYKIPKEFLDKKMILTYTDYNGSKIKMNIKPNSLTEKLPENTYKLTETVSLEASVLENIELRIDSVEVWNSFKVDYTYCTEHNECYPSYEYIKPELSNNKEVLLKVKGKLEKTTNKYKNLYTFIRDFGYIEYEISGKTKRVDLNSEIKPKKTILENEFYVEVLEEVKYAEKIQIVFKIRNKTYKYIVK